MQSLGIIDAKKILRRVAENKRKSINVLLLASFQVKCQCITYFLICVTIMMPFVVGSALSQGDSVYTALI